MCSSAMRSSSSIVIPGSSTSAQSASVSWTSSPASAMPSISAADLRMIMRLACTLLERVRDLGPDLVDGALCVHLHQLACREVVVDDLLGLLVVVAQPALDRLGLVVGAALERGALAEPLAAPCRRKLEQEHGRERPVDLLEHRVERLGLRDVAREAVEHEAVLRVVLGEPVADERDRHVVGNELARLEQRLDLPAELGCRRRSPRGTCRRSRCAGSRTPPRSSSPASPSRSPAARASGCSR